MMRKTISILMAAAFLFASAGMAFAGDKGNKRKGKHLYRKVYKTCYERGATDSKKPVLNPDAKTQAQWTRFFEKGNFEDLGCPEEWAGLSEKDLLDIYTYLHAYAADSPTPAKCK